MNGWLLWDQLVGKYTSPMDKNESLKSFLMKLVDFQLEQLSNEN